MRHYKRGQTMSHLDYIKMRIEKKNKGTWRMIKPRKKIRRIGR